MQNQPPATIAAALELELARFPDSARRLLSRLLHAESFAGHIGAADAQTLGEQAQFTPGQLMLALVPFARCYAHPVISGYHAGAVARSSAGDLFFGGNLEFAGMALNATVHAEQAAVLQAFRFGASSLSDLAVGGTPCGHCRQFLLELNNPQLQILTPRGTALLAEMLPDAFSPGYLGNEQGLMSESEQALSAPAPARDVLQAAAIQMARRSYAPYSQNWAGVAIRTNAGTIVAAPYIENVAFNPSLSPLPGVLVAMRLQRLPWDTISRAVLAESKQGLSSQELATRTLLATLVDSPLELISLTPEA